MLTSLDPGEFERLLAAFDAALQDRRHGQNYVGQARQRRPGAGRQGILGYTRSQLFFLLFYFECYPLQKVMAVLFGVSPGQVSLLGKRAGRPWSTRP